MNENITTVELAYKKFVAYLKDLGRSHSTILAYGADLRQLKHSLEKRGKKFVKDITVEDLRNFKQELKEDKEFSPKTISRKINSMRTFFRFLIKERLVEENLAEELEQPEIEVTPPNFLSKTEYRALRDACRNDTRIYAIVELLLQTGVRVGEITNIRLEDIGKNYLFIRPHGKYKGRKVPLNEAAKKAIENYLNEREETNSEFLFITKSGKKLLIRNIRTIVDRYFEQAGIKDGKLNDLRNTFIVHQLKAGVPLTTVSRLAGHKQITTTERYLKLAKATSPKPPKSDLIQL
jgi:site-specific recombinase XerD